MCAPRPQHPWASSGELCVEGVFFLGVPALEGGEKAQGWGPGGERQNMPGRGNCLSKGSEKR